MSSHLKEIGRNIYTFSSNYDTVVLLGDFDVEPAEQHMKYYSLNYNCKNIISDKTYCKNPVNPRCIDLILRNIIQHTK